ncbi:MAG: amidohydrolase family protein [Thermodesulfobacteriota bacterium]
MSDTGNSDLSQGPLPCEWDREGDSIPGELDLVLDCHVHLFPDKLFQAIWNWFDTYGWEIRYKIPWKEIVDFLSARGVRNFTGLVYAHKPGIAKKLNEFMFDVCKSNPGVIGFATVYPGEEGAQDILRQAFAKGLQGVKLHPHVQFFHPDSDSMQEICQVCSEEGKPIMIHAGREPKTPLFDYPMDPYEMCSASKTEYLLKNFPELRICVPHLGAAEFSAYRDLCLRYDNLWLDSSMAISKFLPGERPPDLKQYRTDRIMYGSDFPNIPYAWDREIYIALEELDKKDVLDNYFWKNALEFLHMDKSCLA